MVNVIGLGYIGLPTALMMATHGVEVVGTDYNEELVATLNAGHTTFKEEGLDELFVDALKSGIKFTTEYQVCDTYIVSVPTPYDKLDKKIDPCYVIAACKTVLEVAPKGAVLVIESTISPNTVDRFVRPLLIEAEREDVKLVHAPERIIPGNMVYELLHNNRTIGADDPEVGEEVAKIYATFCQGEISVTDIRTSIFYSPVRVWAVTAFPSTRGSWWATTPKRQTSSVWRFRPTRACLSMCCIVPTRLWPSVGSRMPPRWASTA